MLNNVSIQNFKNILRAHIDLEPLTVFVGPNGSGKTSVLEAIHLAYQAVEADSSGGIQSVFEGRYHPDWLYKRGGNGTLSIDLSGVAVVFADRPSGFPPPSIEQYGKTKWHFRGRQELNIHLARRYVNRLSYLRLALHKLAAPSYSDTTPPQLDGNGEGLPSVLAYMALNDPDRFDDLVNAYCAMLPQVKRLRFTKTPVFRTESELVRFGNDTVERQTKREYQGDAIIFDFNNAPNISAASASEGTLMLLGLMTILLGPSPPDVLLIDDLERGLHPLAQKSLIGMLRTIMKQFPNLQILATAHSPYLLDNLEPREVRLLTTRADNGTSICGKLTDHPEFDKWKNEMAPGEMWSLFGEKWLAEKETRS